MLAQICIFGVLSADDSCALSRSVIETVYTFSSKSVINILVLPFLRLRSYV